MSLYAVIIVLVFILGIIAEVLVSFVTDRNLYEWKDTRANLALGAWALLMGSVSFFLGFWTFTLVHYLTPEALHFGDTWTALILCMIGNELVHYFFHRWGHEWRILWAFHVTHHSSKNFNLTTAHRLNTHVSHRHLFWAVLAIFFDPVMILFVDSISQIHMFFIHTAVIGKLGPLEKILNTPSHHRVHHGTNPQYIDKNYGGILIIWDKIFGTFEPEVEEPVYGITKPLDTYNPVKIASHGWIETFKEAGRKGSVREALRYLFSRPD